MQEGKGKGEYGQTGSKVVLLDGLFPPPVQAPGSRSSLAARLSNGLSTRFASAPLACPGWLLILILTAFSHRRLSSVMSIMTTLWPSRRVSRLALPGGERHEAQTISPQWERPSLSRDTERWHPLPIHHRRGPRSAGHLDNHRQHSHNQMATVGGVRGVYFTPGIRTDFRQHSRQQRSVSKPDEATSRKPSPLTGSDQTLRPCRGGIPLVRHEDDRWPSGPKPTIGDSLTQGPCGFTISIHRNHTSIRQAGQGRKQEFPSCCFQQSLELLCEPRLPLYLSLIRRVFPLFP